MSKILIEGNKVIIDGHANDLETCNTLTNLCDELSKSEKFRTVKYESGYGEFESVSGNEDRKFAGQATLFSHPVNIQSNDGATILAENNLVETVVVTSTDVQLKNGSAINATYTYSGSKLFAGLATSANATVPKYKPGDTIEITAETTFYIVENIIIPEHHSSLTELFTNIATVIREKTGDAASIVADDFPDVIRDRLQVIPPIPYLTFSSPNSFTLKVKDTKKHWDGTLEYSTDTSTWSTWDGTTTLYSVTRGSDNVLYLRGIGNTVITGNYENMGWVLTGTDIKCIGNIENLLDYATVESFGHPPMAGHCYLNMFIDCTSLTQAPELPATTLADGCYYGMFSDCTSLTQAPSLPATTLKLKCYYFMFRGCTSLTQAPELPATTLADYCYHGMFNRCTSLTRAPSLPATTLADGCYMFMFEFTVITAIPRIIATTYATDSCKGMFDDIKTLNVYSSSGPGHEYGWTAPASTYCSVMFGSDDGESEWAKLDGSNFPNSGTPTEGTTYYFATSD